MKKAKTSDIFLISYRLSTALSAFDQIILRFAQNNTQGTMKENK